MKINPLQVESVAAVSKLYSAALYLRITYCNEFGDIPDKPTSEAYDILMMQQRNLVRVWHMPRRVFAYAVELGSCYAQRYFDAKER